MDDLADPRRLACIVHALFLAGGAPTRKVSEVDVDANGSDTIALRSRVAHRIDAAESRSLVRHAVDLDETDADFHAGRHRPASYQNVANARKSVVSGKSVSVGIDLGGRRFIKKKTTQMTNSNTNKSEH